MAILHSNNTRLKAMDLPHLKATDLLHNRATDHHRSKAIRRKVIQAILLREDRHHSQVMEAMVRHHPNHRELTVDTNSLHRLRARAMGRLYQEDHSMEGDQVFQRQIPTLLLKATPMPHLPRLKASSASAKERLRDTVFSTRIAQEDARRC